MTIDHKLFGKGLLGAAAAPTARGVLAEKFLMPPFSVLNARDGAWQARKRKWLALGLEGEVGRSAILTYDMEPDAYDGPWSETERGELGSRKTAAARGVPGRAVNPGGAAMPAANYSQNKARGDGRGRAAEPAGRKSGLTYTGEMGEYDYYRNKEGKKGGKAGLNPAGGPQGSTYGNQDWVVENSSSTVNSTSIFDPVLCELCYRWWCPPGGQIVDPFAGGAVRGVIAHLMDYRYWGCDLRQEQIDANLMQAERLLGPEVAIDELGNDRYCWPVWVCGDSRVMLPDATDADFIFSCPPYGDLERYSEDPLDLSTMPLREFREAYFEVITKACARLKDNRFACFVIGDYRDKEGCYTDFPGLTNVAFRRAGLRLYNEAILVTAVASLSMRAGKQMEATRKLGRGHQNVLCYVKGDPRKAADACKGEV